ncbi:hypothetical protein BDB01DRAFT_895485 [Pilobolus umbonatus]|nr:hypothetical protein BDB01DRAFT_895485 [Pilobolus umbonatus]
MDHEQQVIRLHDFNQEIQSHPESAPSYATKDFLQILTDLMTYGLNQTDTGTDNYKEELNTLKSSIRAFTTVLPTIFKTVCQNEAESRLWEKAKSIIHILQTRLINHKNTGIRINAIKSLQVLVLLLSKSPQKDLSLSMIRPDHRILSGEETEGNQLFNTLVSLMDSDIESVVTATISCLVLIGKKRVQYLKPIISAFTSWQKIKKKVDSPVMLRNVDKILKLSFISLIRTESLSSYRAELIAAFGSIGGNTAMFQRHSREHRSEEIRRKRAAAASHDTDREKRPKHSEYIPIIPSSNSRNILEDYDIMQLPLSAVVSLCMTVLQTVPLEVINERINNLPTEGVTLAVTRPHFVRSTTPPYPPPPDQPETIHHPRMKNEREEEEKRKRMEEERRKVLKREEEDAMILMKSEVKEEKIKPVKDEPVKIEMDSDDEIEQNYRAAIQFKPVEEDVPMEEDKPKVELLASVEERATQALRMKPYALATPTPLVNDDKQQLLKMAIQRILAAESAFQTNTVVMENGIRKTDNINNSTKSVWMTLITKLVLKSINQYETPFDDESRITNKDQVDEIKEMLLEFIVANISTRVELAIEWLHEEYLSDIRLKRNISIEEEEEACSYFKWFHRLLEKCIPTLDAKDRTLTKLLVDAPALNDDTICYIKKNLEEVPERFVSCVSTLRSLVANRPTIRFSALQVLLDLCVHPNDKMRRTSIVAVKKWNPNQQDIHARVEEFSIQSLDELVKIQDPPKADHAENGDNMAVDNDNLENENTEEAKDNIIEKDVVRHAELYFVLCTKKPILLKELFSVYIQASETVQKYIRLHMINMIKSIGMRSPDLIKLIREFPPGGETLVIRILFILCESKPPTREIMSTLHTIAKERSIDLKNLSPILAGNSINPPMKK